MKKITIASLFLTLQSSICLSQSYLSIPTTTAGYNIDAVAENTTALANTSSAIDGSNFVLYSAFYGSLYSPAGTGLPNNGLISSGTRTYQLQPYTQNNLLYLLAGQGDSLIFTTPASYASFSFLSFATEGSATMSVTVRFTDNSTQTYAAQTVSDWFGGAGAIISGFDRVSRSGTAPAYVSGNPRMYASDYTLTCANRLKQVRAVLIKHTGSAGRLCVAAVSGASVPAYSASVTNISCAGSTSSISIITSGGLPPFTYNWGTSPVQTAATATGLAVGSYTYSVSDAIGCTFTSTAIMPPNTGTQAPPTLLPFQNPICSGQSLAFNAVGAASYSWTGGITNGVGFIPTAFGAPSVVDYTVTGANSCNTSTNSSVVSLTVNPNPTVTAASSSPTLCSGASVTLTGVGAVSYTWNGGVTNAVGFSPAFTNTYTVSGSNTLNCSASSVIIVTVVTTPTLAPVASPSTICIGNSSTLTALGATNYTWLPGNFNTSSITISPTSNTTYTVIKANSNCVDTKTISMTVNLLPVVTAASSSNSVCAGTTATLMAASVLGSTYTWQPTGVNGSSVIVSPPALTVYTVTANNGTCAGTTTLSLSVISIPTITAVASVTSICAGESVTLSASGALSYTWNVGGGTTGQSVVASPTVPTLFTVTGINNAGCTAVASQIVVTNTVPVITVSVSDFTVCNGNSSTLTASGSGGGTNSYTWSTLSTSTSIIVTPSNFTTYTVTGVNSSGCSASTSISINVITPVITITGNTVVCSGKSAVLSASGAGTYSWSSGSPISTTTVTPLSNTIYTVSTITTSNNIACPSSGSVQVTVNPNPTINLSSNRGTTICKNETVVFTASATGVGANSYSWSTSSATTPTISMTPTLITSIFPIVTGTDANGCQGTASVTVRVDACTGLTEMNPQNNGGIQIYPNPNHGNFYIAAQSAVDLKIISMSGQLIQQLKLAEENNFTVELNHLSEGIYFVVGNGEKALSKKIVVVK